VVTTRTFTPTECEPDEPHDKEYGRGDPQHMKCEPRTEQYEYKQ
jgi:hypothetical protein